VECGAYSSYNFYNFSPQADRNSEVGGFLKVKKINLTWLSRPVGLWQKHFIALGIVDKNTRRVLVPIEVPE